MEILQLSHPLDQSFGYQEPHVMALGFFDGVHLGHQLLLQQAYKIAKKKNIKFSVMTFAPHPSEIIKNEKDKRYITPLPFKLDKIAAFGADQIFLIRFSQSFATLPAGEFIKQYVVELNAKHLVVGFDFTCGYKGQGNVEYLRSASKNNPFEVSVVSKKTTNGNKVSSTIIRKLINDGNVHLVPYYLGKHYEIKGSIHLSTDLRAQEIKLYLNEKYVLPKPGVYKVEIANGSKAITGFLRYDLTSETSFELSSNKLEWIKEWNQQDVTIKLLSKEETQGRFLCL